MVQIEARLGVVKATVKPESEEPTSVVDVPAFAGVVGWVNVIVWFALSTLTVRWTWVAAL
jgi:hypothetical protein